MNRFQSILRHSDLLFNNWGIIPRLVKDYFSLFFLKKKVLRKVDIALTFSCNANCRHCFSATLMNAGRKEVSINEIKNTLRQAVKLGAIAVEFTGGEPLLCPHLDEAVRFAKGLRSIVGITTNGILLTESRIADLRKAGLDIIQISLDSMCFSDHDKSRGVTGCYDKVMRAIELIKTNNIGLMLSTIATNENIENNKLMEVVDFARKCNVPVSLNPASNVGGWRGRKDVTLSKENRNIYREIMKTSHVRWAGDLNFLQKGCPCGRETAFVTAYGDVVPCGFIQISYGNIRAERLDAIWKRMHQYPLGDAKKSLCQAGLDDKFIAQYINPLAEKEKLPIFIHDYPLYKTEKSRDENIIG